jgi:hypothetical protein
MASVFTAYKDKVDKFGDKIYKEIDSILFQKCNICQKYKPYNEENFPTTKVNKYTLRRTCNCCYENSNRKLGKKPIFNLNGELFCTKCSSYKDENNFRTRTQSIKRNGKHTICKNCEEELKKEKIKEVGEFTYFITNILKSCKGRNKEYNLDLDYIIDLYVEQCGKCKISNILMTYKHCSETLNSSTNISIDRIDSSKGYIKGNIQLLTSWANTMKNSKSTKELIEMCKSIVEFNMNKDS